MARPTVSDLARHARIPAPEVTGSADDLTRYLNAAIGMVESWCGPMDPDAVVRVRLQNGRFLLLPFLGVESATVTGPDGEAVEVLGGGADVDAGVLSVSSRAAGTYGVVVVRPQQVLDALFLATLIIAAHTWDVRRGSPSSGGEYGAPEVMYAPGAGYAVPRRAAELLAPWRTVVMA